ncbi:thioredoxin family protein [Herbiconiux gentiana]|uniref:thioredoxin family protein n=1 Tax=Herbiconiux gentiana TaxID=2970912 RepID=UPI00217EC9CA|nr:thioredoxin family protein [Herbiconiux gentiana]
MRVEILHIDECPNWVEAGVRAQEALTELGHGDVEVTYRLLSNSVQASEVPFAGSPTILLDGVDAFPSGGRTSELACRVYRSDSGFAGAPSVAQLIEAIRDHVA